MLAAVLLVLAAACSPGGEAPEPTPSVAPVVVGAGPEQESQLLAAIAVGLLEAEDVAAELRVFDERRDARQALEFEDVDVLPGYTGATWLEVLDRADPPGDPLSSYRRVRQLDLSNGVTWLRPSFGREERIDRPPANATFAFFVRGLPAPSASLQTLSQLASRLADQPDAALCVDPDFAERPDGLEQVLDAYSIPRGIRRVAAAPEDAVAGVAAGGCVAGLSTATDGQAWRAGLKPLRDDLEIFPAFVVSLQVVTELRRERPEIEDALEPLLSYLTTARLGGWNAHLAAGEAVEVVAADAVQALLALQAADQAPPSTPTASPEDG